MFKGGDLIEGKPSASDEYTITKEGGTYVVVGIPMEYAGTVTVEVKVFPANAESRTRGPFVVDSKHFQLINLNLINE